MDELMARIAAKKAALGRLRAAAGAGLGNLEHVHDLELTYTSNAIEGNTLSAAETTLIIEQGMGQWRMRLTPWPRKCCELGRESPWGALAFGGAAAA
jgi:hypothetical protein